MPCTINVGVSVAILRQKHQTQLISKYQGQIFYSLCIAISIFCYKHIHSNHYAELL